MFITPSCKTKRGTLIPRKLFRRLAFLNAIHDANKKGEETRYLCLWTTVIISSQITSGHCARIFVPAAINPATLHLLPYRASIYSALAYFHPFHSPPPSPLPRLLFSSVEFLIGRARVYLPSHCILVRQHLLPE